MENRFSSFHPRKSVACVCVRERFRLFFIAQSVKPPESLWKRLWFRMAVQRKLSHTFSSFPDVENLPSSSKVIIFSSRIKADKCNFFIARLLVWTALCMMRGLKYITFLWLTRRKTQKAMILHQVEEFLEEIKKSNCTTRHARTHSKRTPMI